MAKKFFFVSGSCMLLYTQWCSGLRVVISFYIFLRFRIVLEKLYFMKLWGFGVFSIVDWLGINFEGIIDCVCCLYCAVLLRAEFEFNCKGV